MNDLFVIVSAIIALAATLSAGMFIKRLKSNIGIICAFSAGFFVSLSLFDLIPSVFAMASENQIPLENPLLTASVGFFLLFFLDRIYSMFHQKSHKMAMGSLRPRIGLLSTLEFCSHGLIEGLAIGVSFQVQVGLGVFVAIAVISHDFCDGISTLALMLNSGNTAKSSMSMLFVDALAPVLGAASTFLFSISNYLLVFVLSFLVGSFLYIANGSLLPDAYHMNSRPVKTIAFVLLGFFLVLLFSLIV